MNPTREEVLFALALEKPAAKRAAFLDVMCEGDTALRQRLGAPVVAHDIIQMNRRKSNSPLNHGASKENSCQ